MNNCRISKVPHPPKLFAEKIVHLKEVKGNNKDRHYIIHITLRFCRMRSKSESKGAGDDRCKIETS